MKTEKRSNLKKEIEKVAKWYDARDGFRKGWAGFQRTLAYYRYLAVKKFFKGDTILEMGVADGEMTQYFFKHFPKVVGLEGSEHFIEETKAKFPRHFKSGKLKFIHSLFEEYEVDDKYDTILAGHVIEHMVDPVDILIRVKSWAAKDGTILILVPNANSIHRRIGVKMGLLKRPGELNEQDKKLGHLRNYTWETLERDIASSGLKIKEMGGIFFKPLANSQIEKWCPKELINAFYELGKEFPRDCAEIYACCVKK